MNGFQIARYSLDEALRRIEDLKEFSVLPVDDDGQVIEDDPTADSSAREMRLVLQRILDLDVGAFLLEMRRLFFHLFSVDHDHYRDLLMQALRRDPLTTKEFALEFLISDEVIFFDDQYTLHDLLDLIEALDSTVLDANDLRRLKSLLHKPFFRLPSLLGRLAKFLAPTLDERDLRQVHRLFEMDLIPAKELTWEQFLARVGEERLPRGLRAPLDLHAQLAGEVTAGDFEDLRWAAGIDGSTHGLAFRMLGCLAARGPWADELFIEMSEAQQDSVFRREHFETEGQRFFFRQGLAKFRQEIVREAHRSGEWFVNVPLERSWSWTPPPPPDPWPSSLRFLTFHWGEFANPTDGSEFATDAIAEIGELDRLGDAIVDLLRKHPLPSADLLEEGDRLLRVFVETWNRLLPRILERLDIVP